MRWSRALIPTLKETPSDAVAPSHRLMLRAGMIRQLGAGAYSYLPLGLRVLNKVERIVREEMDAAGAQELLMPALQPIELWKETGRYETFGDLLMQLKTSSQQHFALGPTHEEVVTDIVRGLVNSYRQLPVTLYQIQTKFRDEARPRFGVIRTREFIMKDAYSFDTDVEGLNGSYERMYEAYCRIFERCGIPFVIVEAESGPIGGDSSHEFMVPAEIGEDVILQDPTTGYAANVERAGIGEIPRAEPSPDALPYKAVPTPGVKTIQEVCAFLKAKPNKTAKLLVFLADGKPVAVLVRGDHEANEAKVRRAFKATTLVPAEADDILKATGAPMGFLGPVGCKLSLVVDQSVAAMKNAIVGGNEVDVHLVGVVPGRDFPLDNVQDVRNAVAGDPSPKSGAPMIETRGIEIGHVFKLGTKYSKAMGAGFLDEKGETRDVIMGCYGIGLNRIVASAIEASHDADGISWPLPIAPYQVLVVPLQVNNAEVVAAAEQLYSDLQAAGVDVLLDDRDLRPGVKFKDGDLIGIPLRVVIGERGLKEGQVELKWRQEAQAKSVAAEGIAATVKGELDARIEADKARRAEGASKRASG